ncbi:MAG: hypothetical protein ACOY3Z_00215 [Thermodesulfobacteriota bacterium]
MKKMLIFALLGVIPASVTSAEELVVNLTSGNAVVIQYTGAIQGVSFKGTTDAIAGVNMPAPAATVAPASARGQQPVVEKQQVVNTQTEKVSSPKEEGRFFRIKWAPPISED